MRAGAAGAATFRHVSLVALEALLVAMLVWIAAMTAAGASQSGGIAGSAQAGLQPVSVTIRNTGFGAPATVATTNVEAGSWVHVACTRAGDGVLSLWAPLDTKGRVTLTLGSSSDGASGPAACSAEVGYFAANGRWRTEGVASFSVSD
jgi:hypothetical protein